MALAQNLKGPLSEVDGLTRVVCPPFISLMAVAAVLDGSPIAVGAQDLYPEPKGAFTGEVSGTMLQGICRYAIVGHSERRHIFGETDDLVHRKVAAALELGLTPILCVGETMEERDGGLAQEVVVRQLRLGMEGLGGEAASVVVAYEPVWAIGTGRAATPDLAQEMMDLMRRTLAEIVTPDAAAQVPLLYGGSVTAENIGGFAAQPDVDGALVGGASLRAEEFVAIARAIAAARRGA